MATEITARTEETIRGRHKYVSGIATIASNDHVLISGLDPGFENCSVGVHMFNGAGARVVGGAGTFTVSYVTEQTGDASVAATFEDPASAVITAATPTTITWKANTFGVKVVEAGVTTALTWQAVLIANDI